MHIDAETIDWLLEEDNPGVRVRALIGLCDFTGDHPAVREARHKVLETLPAVRDLSWMALKGQVLVYNLTALAESGLSKEDVKLGPVIDKLLSQPFDANCSDLMALRAMVMLGYGSDGRVAERLERVAEARLPDGGWLCLHRVRKMKRVPKSCIRVNMHGLLLGGELQKQGLCVEGTEKLLHYFRKRRLFYRTDNPAQLVLNYPGRRMTDVFFPNEYFHVGLPVLLEAVASLGEAKALGFQEAWSLLRTKRDAMGKVVLEGTLPSSKTYLPRERVGKPSKWGTLYAFLAWKAVE